MKSTRHLSLAFGLLLPFSSHLVACGGGDEPVSGDATGGTGAGGSASGGGTGSGGGEGTGGSAPILRRVPGTDNYNCTPPEGAPGALQLTEVGSGFSQPILVVHPPNDARLFVVEQNGVIKINGGGTFLDISEKVVGPGDTGNDADERGLLGLAFHPDYASNGIFYVHYSQQSSGGDTVIAEYSVGASADVADESSEKILLTVNQNHENHNGGTITFGPDGYLYIALGDNGADASSQWGGDPDGNGQNPTTMPGSILRIAPVLGGTYTSPDGNYPGALPEIWSMGLRNPYRINFDACEGDLYIGDVGQNLKEELNVVRAGDSGKNFGWNKMEGTGCFDPNDFNDPLDTCDTTGLTLPVLEYENGGGSAIIGGTVYRGTSIPWLRGTYIYADNVKNSIYSTVYDATAGTASTPQNLTGQLSPNYVTAIQNGSDGEIYVVSALGSIYQITAL